MENFNDVVYTTGSIILSDDCDNILARYLICEDEKKLHDHEIYFTSLYPNICNDVCMLDNITAKVKLVKFIKFMDVVHMHIIDDFHTEYHIPMTNKNFTYIPRLIERYRKTHCQVLFNFECEMDCDGYVITDSNGNNIPKKKESFLDLLQEL